MLNTRLDGLECQNRYTRTEDKMREAHRKGGHEPKADDRLPQ